MVEGREEFKEVPEKPLGEGEGEKSDPQKK